MSKINLPPLPPVPGEIIVDEDCEGGAVYGQDKDALCAWATAYAEQAVRQALAAQETRAWLIRERKNGTAIANAKGEQQ